LESATGRPASKGPIERRARERNHVHLLGARLSQRAGALVDRRARRVDVVDQRQPARARASREGAADVAPARARVETALGTDAARAPDERHDRQVPPARQLGRQLGGRVGAALQQAVAYRRHDGERVDGRPRQFVGDERGGQVPG
jgi:hypothetical protein